MASSLPERLRDAFLRCCGDEASEELEAAARREFVEILSSPLCDVELRRDLATKWLAQCEQVLQQAVELLDPSTSSGLACQDYCVSIIEGLAENCSPREMFAAFVEAWDVYTASQTLVCCIPLVQGLSLLFSRLRRRQAQVFQEGSSGLLALMHLAAQDGGDNDEDEEDEESKLFRRWMNTTWYLSSKFVQPLCTKLCRLLRLSEKLAML